MALNTVTLTFDLTDMIQAGIPAVVTIVPTAVLTDVTDGLVIPKVPRSVVTTSGLGQLAGIVANDNANIAPAGTGYVITVTQGAVTLLSETVQILFANGATQALASLTPAVVGPVVTTYALAGAGRPATFTVAASNASAAWKANADYVCTGTNDDVKLNAAMAALPSQGGTVLLSDGTFTIGHALIPAVSRTKLLGQGPDCTVIQAAVGANCNGYQFDVSQAVSLIFCSIEGVTFNGNYNSGGGNTSGYGCHVNYNATFTFWDFYLRDVWFENWAQDGFWSTGGHGYLLDHVLAEFEGVNGINFTGGFTDTPPRIINGTVKTNGGSGILVNVTDAYIGHMEVSGNSGSYGIALTLSGAKVIGCQVRSNTGTGIHASGNEGHEIIGNTISGNGQYGVLADSPANTITGNFLNNNSTSSAGTYDEIRVQTGGASAPGNMITGNVIDCQNQSGYGINFASANAFGGVAVANRIINARTGTFTSAAPDSLFLDPGGLTYGSGSARALGLTPLLAPAGATAETFPRQYSSGTYFGSLASGTAYLSAIPLPAGLPVNNITLIVGGSPAFTVVTHGWYALLDPTRIVRAVSADQSGTWQSAFQTVTLSVAAAGYVTPSPGCYYIAFCATFTGSGQFPAMASQVGGLTTGLSPVLCGSSSTGLSTPPSAGTQLAIIAGAAGDRFYGYTS